jgi:hypothetical protein
VRGCLESAEFFTKNLHIGFGIIPEVAEEKQNLWWSGQGLARQQGKTR